MNKKTDKTNHNTIALNKKAQHDYFVEETYEAGIALMGWEIKSIRAGRTQLVDSYIVIKHDEAFWLGGHITPLAAASTHVSPDPQRTRKLLLHKREIEKLIGCTERQGYTVVPLKLHWNRGRAKLLVGLVKGKKQHDKRETEKARDWQREKQRLMKLNR
jgi:SsrA-binding protein